VGPVENLAQGPAWAQLENKHRPVLIVIEHAKEDHKVWVLKLHPKFDLLLDFFTHPRREVPASTKDLECNLRGRVHTLSWKSIRPAHDISETSTSKVKFSVNTAPTFF
jgi:hypothetical protein